MKTKLLLTTLLSFSFYLLSSQVPQGLNYQAIARDASGNPITGQPLQVELSIQSDTTASPAVVWQELFNPVNTNAFGLFTVVIGNGVRQSGSALLFTDINWNVPQLFLKIRIYNSGTWKNMGQAKLWTVPYAMTSGELAGSVKKLEVVGDDTQSDEALFEVKRKDGALMFAVYNHGVRINMPLDTNIKARKGGFAIGGFDKAKGVVQDYFVVNPDSIRAYIDTNPGKARRGGFAIGGFDKAKAGNEEYLRVTRDSTRVYVRQPAKGQKGGFAIGGFSAAKASVSNFLDLTSQNYFIGEGSGGKNTTGLYNSFIGYRAGYSNTEGLRNSFLGYFAGYSNITGYSNIFIGDSSGYKNSTGMFNVFIGNNSGNKNTIGYNNIFLGEKAGFSNTTGNRNVSIGAYAGRETTEGICNVFIGNFSGGANKTGNYNVMMGRAAGILNTSGSSNIYLGMGAGWNGSIGNNNIYLGQYAGYNSNGSGNVFIGFSAGYNELGSQRLYIQNSDADPSNALIYGEFDNKYLKLNALTSVKDALILEPRSTAPPSPVKGMMYFDSTDNILKVWNGSAWMNCW
jgi:hypothetical protein